MNWAGADGVTRQQLREELALMRKVTYTSRRKLATLTESLNHNERKAVLLQALERIGEAFDLFEQQINR